MDLKDIKLSVFEASENGDISVQERDALLDVINYKEDCMMEADYHYDYTLTKFNAMKDAILRAHLKYAEGIVEWNRKKRTKILQALTDMAMEKYMKVPSLQALTEGNLYDKRYEEIIEKCAQDIEEHTKGSHIKHVSDYCRRIVIREAKEYPVKDADRYIRDVKYKMTNEMNLVRFKPIKIYDYDDE